MWLNHIFWTASLYGGGISDSIKATGHWKRQKSVILVLSDKSRLTNFGSQTSTLRVQLMRLVIQLFHAITICANVKHVIFIQVGFIGQALRPGNMLLINGKGKFVYFLEERLEIKCKMDFATYPMDQQICYFRMLSPLYRSNELVSFVRGAKTL